MTEALPYIVPLAVLLIVLIGLHRVRETVNPIFVAMVTSLAKHASSNATDYAIGMMFGLSASLSAIYDVLSQIDRTTAAGMSPWQWMAIWSKVLNPFVVAFLAYAQRINPKQP